ALPCAVPINCTPRSAIVRAAMASSSRPISSITITSGLWFSTASIITSCWRSGCDTCMRRALPLAGRGTSPSPPHPLEATSIALRMRHLHASRLADGGMRHIAIAADLVRSVDDDDAAGFRQNARGFAQHRRFANARRAEQEHALAGFDQVLQDRDRTVYRAPDTCRQADYIAPPVANGGNAMQRALHASPVIGGEAADPGDNRVDVVAGDFVFTQNDFAIDISRRRHAPQVEDDLKQVVRVTQRIEPLVQMTRQHTLEFLYVVCYPTFHVVIYLLL